MRIVLGFDIGGTKCAALLARVGGGIDIFDKERFDTLSGRGPDAVLDDLYRAADLLLERNNLESSALAAIGVSCGGPLDSRRGVVVCPPNLPGWINIPLVELLEKRFGAPAFLQNDANACALVEWKLGAGRGTRDMVFLTMGTGMGGGIIAEGRLLRGACDLGGEIGHLRLAEDGPIGFGKAGSFEGFTSGGGIARQIQAFTEERVERGGPPVWYNPDDPTAGLSARELAGYARRGDADALELFHKVGTMLGKGVALLIDTLNPERVVIGSIFARCGDLLRPAMEASLRAEAIPAALERCEVVPAETGEALGDLASVMTALYAMGIEPTDGLESKQTDSPDDPPSVTARLDRLIERYPALAAARGAIQSVYGIIRDTYLRGGKLLICGNGGSCADAQHIVGELMKGFYLKRPLPGAERAALADALGEGGAELAGMLQGSLPAIALSEHSALNTAFANDVDASLAFAQQVVGYGRPGDTLLGISTSGNARNVLLAARAARARGLGVAALTGGTGGMLSKAADAAIVVPASVTADAQELHLPVYHTLCAMLEERFFGLSE